MNATLKTGRTETRYTSRRQAEAAFEGVPSYGDGYLPDGRLVEVNTLEYCKDGTYLHVTEVVEVAK
jgi:hypothetical protein